MSADIAADVMMLEEDHQTRPTTSMWYGVPAFRDLRPGVSELELVIFSWTLLLYRRNHGADVHFSYASSCEGHSKGYIVDIGTEALHWEGNTSLAALLEQSQAPVKEKLCCGENPAFIYLNDEAAPNNMEETVHMGQRYMSWGSVEVRVAIEEGGVRLQYDWRRPFGGDFLARHLTLCLVEILQSVHTIMNEQLKNVLHLGNMDRSLIWSRNMVVPPMVEDCVHRLISNKAREQPDVEAICAWDGTFSYLEVDELSTLLAHHLTDLGLQTGHIVPLNFEKSKWTVVAILAVMKSGAAFALMDPKQPIQRRQTMASQVGATFVITSGQYLESGKEIASNAQVVALDEKLIQALKSTPSPDKQLPSVRPDSLMYVIFTSGTTGLPKGIMINFNTYTSGALERQKSVGYDTMSRVLDFTSYTFDVSIDSMLVTLTAGGCVCVPSDEDRMSDLSGSIRRLRVNMANMTPSVARVLDPDILPSLRSLGVGGEAVALADISDWGKQTRIVIGYGVSECTTACTVNSSAAGKPYVSIGSASASALWLVDPTDHTKLAPVGAVGEMLIEGPIVGAGYLGQPEKTAAAFIHDPPWLLNGDVSQGIPGRRGRMYRTGDLVRSDPDGNGEYLFIGRRDTQVKLRGQRIELSEIEYNIKSLLPPGTEVASDIVARGGRAQDRIIAAFITSAEGAPPWKYARDDLATVEEVPFTPDIRQVVLTMEKKLSEVLPSYMVPSAFIGLDRMPRLVSGKVDRKSLVAVGAQATSKTSVANESDSALARPLSKEEEVMRKCWSTVLGMEEPSINATDNFFNLGGDSIRAMKLAPQLREAGYSITVVDIFDFPVLSEMANVVKSHDAATDSVAAELPTFSLLDSGVDVEALMQEAADQCHIERTLIEDIYPCAPMQEIHMAFYTRSKDAYVAQRVADIPDWGNTDRVKAAWEHVYRQSPILRTRIVEFKEHGLMQVVTTGEVDWRSGTSLDAYLDQDKNLPMSVSSPMCRFGLVYDDQLQKGFFIWTSHHAIYDGWSVDLIIERVRAAYAQSPVSRPAEFKHFISWLKEPERDGSEQYWKTQLEGATGPKFPHLPSRSFIPEPDAYASHSVRLDECGRSNFTTAVLIRAAWALISAAYTMSDDVVFAETFAGRAVPLAGALEIEGPMLSSIPIRVRIDRTGTVHDFLQFIQDQSAHRGQHEHLGFQNIRRLSDDAQMACEVATGLVVQPDIADSTSSSVDQLLPSFRQGDPVLEALHFSTYPLMLACGLERDGFRVETRFDSRVITAAQMQRVLLQLEHVVTQLAGDQDTSINEVTLVSKSELQKLWQSNNPESPADVTSVVTNGEADSPRKGDKYPLPQRPLWVVNPVSQSTLVPIGATGELAVEAVIDDLVADQPGIPQHWYPDSVGTDAASPSRSGVLRYTGDLVKFTDDMELIFVGRKEELKQIDGHVVDLATIDQVLASLLPENSRFKSHTVVLKDSANPVPVVAVFIQEEPLSGEQMVEVGFSSHHETLPLSRLVSERLARTIVGLNKILLESLPPYSIPSIWVPVNATSAAGEQIDIHSSEWASMFLTTDLVQDLRQAHLNLRPRLTQLVPSLTTEELALRSVWARLLSIEESNISPDDNFFRLGGDSIVTMRLISALRKTGYNISMANVFQNMKLREMAAALEKRSQEPVERPDAYTPFSLLDNASRETILNSLEKYPAHPTGEIEDALPLTGPQARDVASTVDAPRSAVQYVLLYFNEPVDVPRLVSSFQRLVAAHPILRTVFIQHNDQMVQVVVKDLQAQVSEHIVQGPVEERCKELIEVDINTDDEFRLGVPWLKILLVSNQVENTVVIRLSHAQYDGVSLTSLLQQVESEYQHPETNISSPSFATYLQHQRDSRAENIGYWRGVLQESRLAEIAPPASSQASPVFLTKQVDVSTRSASTTLPVLLTAAWARVLSRTLATPDVTFAAIVSGRDGNIQDVDAIMGPCYQYMPIRVRFEQEWQASHLLECVRSQYLEGSPRATLSFEELRRECAQWAEASEGESASESGCFFPSFVNHINKEFLDAVPFADSRCRIDAYAAHAERPTPPRAILFTEGSSTFLGIEADKDRQELWQTMLEDVAGTVESLVRDPEAFV